MLDICIFAVTFLQDPIKQPLLKKLCNQPDDIKQKAVISFLDIHTTILQLCLMCMQ